MELYQDLKIFILTAFNWYFNLDNQTASSFLFNTLNS